MCCVFVCVMCVCVVFGELFSVYLVSVSVCGDIDVDFVIVFNLVVIVCKCVCVFVVCVLIVGNIGVVGGLNVSGDE